MNLFRYPLIAFKTLIAMAKKKIAKSESEYVRSELEFLSNMKPNEPVIAIISDQDKQRESAVKWLSNKLKGQGNVTGISREMESSNFFRELNPHILIGDSLSKLCLLLNKKPLELIGNGGYIYFKENYRGGEIKEWLQVENRGQHLVEVWIRLNGN